MSRTCCWLIMLPSLSSHSLLGAEIGFFQANFAFSSSFYFLTVCLSFESPFLSISRGFKAIECKKKWVEAVNVAWNCKQINFFVFIDYLALMALSNRDYTDTMPNMGTKNMGFFWLQGYGLWDIMEYGLWVANPHKPTWWIKKGMD